MRKLIRRFEWPLFENCVAAANRDAEARPVVGLDWIFCAAERTSEALGALQDVARSWLALGFERGRYLQLMTAGADDATTVALIRRASTINNTLVANKA
jgi:hypothetical protein